MGRRNLLVEGVSGSGKTTVCDELLRRGIQAIHGDRELAYQGDPATGEPTDVADHWHWLWDVEKVRRIAADRSAAATYFCGGSRNHTAFIDVFDRVLVLEVDEATLRRRLEARPADEFGGRTPDRELVLRLHRSGAGLPSGVEVITIDATAPIADVVDAILRQGA